MKRKAGKRPAKAASPPEEQGRQDFPIVGMGASAGGLEAFEAFFRAMPSTSGMAFVLVVHLDPQHVSILPELLQRVTKMPVHHAEDGTRVQADTVYVIPPNKDLNILNGTLLLKEVWRRHGTVVMPIDSFFRSLAQDQGVNAVGIVLSGTGTDGTLGLKAIKGEAGMVMVQDVDSAKYDGMPRSAISSSIVDYVLPPGRMPEQLIQYMLHATRKPVAGISPGGGEESKFIQKICHTLRNRTRHDFSLYKTNTICRRIERRMNVHNIDRLSEYARFVDESKREADILFKELLIGVTNFFRDAEAFVALKEEALSPLLKEKPDGYTVRAWVPGCSTGEEAYSAAILLHECMVELKLRFNIQIFGTDIDEEAIDTARAGLYPASILADVNAERLKRYFTKEDSGQYRIKKPVREMLVFAVQNIIQDPPFTKVDLLCCRNLLIYLGPEPQKKLLPIFHYSLKPGGILFLGSSETVGQAVDLFAVLDKKWKIYRKKPSATAGLGALELPVAPALRNPPASEHPEIIRRAEEISAIQLLETILKQSATPPCSVIDDVGNVIYIHGRTGRFLEPAEGRASVNILQMARPGLKKELASAIREVSVHKQESVYRGLRVEYDGGQLFMDLKVKPILEPRCLRGMMMVLFEETPVAGKTKRTEPTPVASKGKSRKVEELEKELGHTREDLQTTIEELETSNEEIKSANEELQSTNEELQSTNEELQTSKEELQSLNEEAATVNAELQSRIDELSRVSDDMKNMLDATQIATVFLDMDLRVRRFTASAAKIIPLEGVDVGRPIRLFASNLEGVDLVSRAEGVLDDLAVREEEVKSKDGTWFLMRVRPYRTTANVIDGVVITFDDVTGRKHAEKMVQEAREFAEAIVDTLEEPLIVLDAGLRVVSANRSFYQTFQVTPDDTRGRLFYDLGSRQWDIPALRRLLEEILPENTVLEGFEIEHDFHRTGKRKLLLNARRIQRQQPQGWLILLVVQDITERSRVEKESPRLPGKSANAGQNPREV